MARASAGGCDSDSTCVSFRSASSSVPRSMSSRASAINSWVSRILVLEEGFGLVVAMFYLLYSSNAYLTCVRSGVSTTSKRNVWIVGHHKKYFRLPLNFSPIPRINTLQNPPPPLGQTVGQYPSGSVGISQGQSPWVLTLKQHRTNTRIRIRTTPWPPPSPAPALACSTVPCISWAT